MFSIFRKKTLRREDKHPKMEKAAAFFARKIIKTQNRIANWLSRYEQKMSISQKKMALLLFCISMSIMTGSLLYRGIFTNRNSTPGWLQQQSITIPKTHPIPDSLDLNGLQEPQGHSKIETDSTNK